MRVELRLGGLISLNGREIALGQTHALLDALDRERSVRGAAERLGLSYRSAWGRVLALEEAVGQPVVLKTKGHGSSLTDLGVALRDALAASLERFAASLPEEERALERRLAGLVEAAPPRIRLVASHDPVLMAAVADWPRVVPSIAGSREAVERLLAGQADAAGFHAGAFDPAVTPPFNTLFHDQAFAVRPLFSREQGLMLAAGNPLGIRTVADLARARARFVNRQRGSGTRLWFDHLLEASGVPAEAITGYEVEEFTHQAVAAVIASGAAEAGLGVRAAAQRFGLAFVPVGRETYFLAARSPVAAALFEPLLARIRPCLADTAGYAPAEQAPRSVTVSS